MSFTRQSTVYPYGFDSEYSVLHGNSLHSNESSRNGGTEQTEHDPRLVNELTGGHRVLLTTDLLASVSNLYGSYISQLLCGLLDLDLSHVELIKEVSLWLSARLGSPSDEGLGSIQSFGGSIKAGCPQTLDSSPKSWFMRTASFCENESRSGRLDPLQHLKIRLLPNMEKEVDATCFSGVVFPHSLRLPRGGSSFSKRFVRPLVIGADIFSFASSSLAVAYPNISIPSSAENDRKRLMAVLHLLLATGSDCMLFCGTVPGWIAEELNGVDVIVLSKVRVRTLMRIARSTGSPVFYSVEQLSLALAEQMKSLRQFKKVIQQDIKNHNHRKQADQKLDENNQKNVNKKAHDSKAADYAAGDVNNARRGSDFNVNHQHQLSKKNSNLSQKDQFQQCLVNLDTFLALPTHTFNPLLRSQIDQFAFASAAEENFYGADSDRADNLLDETVMRLMRHPCGVKKAMLRWHWRLSNVSGFMKDADKKKLEMFASDRAIFMKNRKRRKNKIHKIAANKYTHLHEMSREALMLSQSTITHGSAMASQRFASLRRTHLNLLEKCVQASHPNHTFLKPGAEPLEGEMKFADGITEYIKLPFYDDPSLRKFTKQRSSYRPDQNENKLGHLNSSKNKADGNSYKTIDAVGDSDQFTDVDSEDDEKKCNSGNQAFYPRRIFETSRNDYNREEGLFALSKTDLAELLEWEKTSDLEKNIIMKYANLPSITGFAYSFQVGQVKVLKQYNGSVTEQNADEMQTFSSCKISNPNKPKNNDFGILENLNLVTFETYMPSLGMSVTLQGSTYANLRKIKAAIRSVTRSLFSLRQEMEAVRSIGGGSLCPKFLSLFERQVRDLPPVEVFKVLNASLSSSLRDATDHKTVKTHLYLSQPTDSTEAFFQSNAYDLFLTKFKNKEISKEAFEKAIKILEKAPKIVTYGIGDDLWKQRLCDRLHISQMLKFLSGGLSGISSKPRTILARALVHLPPHFYARFAVPYWFLVAILRQPGMNLKFLSEARILTPDEKMNFSVAVAKALKSVETSQVENGSNHFWASSQNPLLYRNLLPLKSDVNPSTQYGMQFKLGSETDGVRQDVKTTHNRFVKHGPRRRNDDQKAHKTPFSTLFDFSASPDSDAPFYFENIPTNVEEAKLSDFHFKELTGSTAIPQLHKLTDKIISHLEEQTSNVKLNKPRGVLLTGEVASIVSAAAPHFNSLESGWRISWPAVSRLVSSWSLGQKLSLTAFWTAQHMQCRVGGVRLRLTPFSAEDCQLARFLRLLFSKESKKCPETLASSLLDQHTVQNSPEGSSLFALFGLGVADKATGIKISAADEGNNVAEAEKKKGLNIFAPSKCKASLNEHKLCFRMFNCQVEFAFSEQPQYSAATLLNKHNNDGSTGNKDFNSPRHSGGYFMSSDEDAVDENRNSPMSRRSNRSLVSPVHSTGVDSPSSKIKPILKNSNYNFQNFNLPNLNNDKYVNSKIYDAKQYVNNHNNNTKSSDCFDFFTTNDHQLQDHLTPVIHNDSEWELWNYILKNELVKNSVFHNNLSFPKPKSWINGIFFPESKQDQIAQNRSVLGWEMLDELSDVEKTRYLNHSMAQNIEKLNRLAHLDIIKTEFEDLLKKNNLLSEKADQPGFKFDVWNPKEMGLKRRFLLSSAERILNAVDAEFKFNGIVFRSWLKKLESSPYELYANSFKASPRELLRKPLTNDSLSSNFYFSDFEGRRVTLAHYLYTRGYRFQQPSVSPERSVCFSGSSSMSFFQLKGDPWESVRLSLFMRSTLRQSNFSPFRSLFTPYNVWTVKDNTGSNNSSSSSPVCFKNILAKARMLQNCKFDIFIPTSSIPPYNSDAMRFTYVNNREGHGGMEPRTLFAHPSCAIPYPQNSFFSSSTLSDTTQSSNTTMYSNFSNVSPLLSPLEIDVTLSTPARCLAVPLWNSDHPVANPRIAFRDALSRIIPKEVRSEVVLAPSSAESVLINARKVTQSCAFIKFRTECEKCLESSSLTALPTALGRLSAARFLEMALSPTCTYRAACGHRLFYDVKFFFVDAISGLQVEVKSRKKKRNFVDKGWRSLDEQKVSWVPYLHGLPGYLHM